MKAGWVLGLTFFCIAFLPASAVWAASCPYCGRSYGAAAPGDGGRVAALRSAHESSCSARRRSSSGNRSGGGRTYVPRGPSASELAARRRNRQKLAANKKGIEYYKKRDWENAIRYFKQAVTYGPRDSVIKQNLKNAQEALRLKTARENRQREEARKIATAKARIGEILDGASSQFGVGATGSPLSFEEKAARVYDHNTAPADSSAVDLRFADPDKPLVIDPRTVKGEPAPGSGAKKGLSFSAAKEVPLPGKAAPPPPAAPQKSRLRQLSDAQLDAEIARTRKVMVGMRDGFLGDVKDLRHWVRESQDAQREALKESLSLLVGALKSKLGDKIKGASPENSQQSEKLRAAAEQLYRDLVKNAGDYAGSPRDRESKLKAAQALLESGYGFLSEAGKKISANGPQAVTLANYLVNYTYQAARWQVSHKQINNIIDHLDQPNGKLAAQKSLSQFIEKLVQERQRRKAAASPAEVKE